MILLYIHCHTIANCKFTGTYSGVQKIPPVLVLKIQKNKYDVSFHIRIIKVPEDYYYYYYMILGNCLVIWFKFVYSHKTYGDFWVTNTDWLFVTDLILYI